MSSAFAAEPPNAQASAARLAELTGADQHDIAIVLGSGWLPAADLLGEPAATFDLSELGGFPALGVTGHSSEVRSIDVSGRRVLVFLGRTHLYEGHGVARVVHGVRTAFAAGAEGRRAHERRRRSARGLSPGQPVLIADHLNLTGRTPLAGRAVRRPHRPVLAPGCAHWPAASIPPLDRGRLRAVCPARTTRPRRRSAWPRQRLGADLVGMSTVLEAIAAREEGAEVLGLSLVTNLAAGLSGEPLDHAEVLAVGPGRGRRGWARCSPRWSAGCDGTS